MGTPAFRKNLIETRILHDNNPKIPNNIHIAHEREPVRILGSFYGNGIKQEDIWAPVIDKVTLTLSRWNKSRPTLDGRCRAASVIVGGFTQYLTRAQGMPKQVEQAFQKLMDDFVYAKAGEYKQNAIGMQTLRTPRLSGGKNLLNLHARNEAIELMRLKAYLNPTNTRPIWAFLADDIIAQNIVSRHKTIESKYLMNPFMQSWQVHVDSPKLPNNIR